MQRHHVAWVAAGLLLTVGTVLMVWTEAAGDEGAQPSGGVADVSEDTQPYFWPGLVVLLIGVGAAVYGWRQAPRGK